jgi:hypothetical protein
MAAGLRGLQLHGGYTRLAVGLAAGLAAWRLGGGLAAWRLGRRLAAWRLGRRLAV